MYDISERGSIGKKAYKNNSLCIFGKINGKQKLGRPCIYGK